MLTPTTEQMVRLIEEGCSFSVCAVSKNDEAPGYLVVMQVFDEDIAATLREMSEGAKLLKSLGAK